jgi:hypothetical protein
MEADGIWWTLRETLTALSSKRLRSPAERQNWDSKQITLWHISGKDQDTAMVWR